MSFGLEPSGSSHVRVATSRTTRGRQFDFAAQIRPRRGDGRAGPRFRRSRRRRRGWRRRPAAAVPRWPRSNATEGPVSADESLADASLVDARFREDRDRAGVVAFTCFAARRDERSFSKDDAERRRRTTKEPERERRRLLRRYQESHVLPDGFDAVLGVAAPCLFVSRKADARAKSGDRSAPARGAASRYACATSRASRDRRVERSPSLERKRRRRLRSSRSTKR